MTAPTGSTRKIKFPLVRNADVESETPESPAVLVQDLTGWTGDSDERVNIVLNLSLNEYIALATCVDVGRDIAYGDNSLYIWWIWVRSLVSMNLCDDIIACIEDTESGVSDAILTITGGQTQTSERQYAQEQRYDLLGDGNNPECDFDEWWGGIDFLVERLNQNNVDALEILEVVTNSSEWVARVVGNITGIDETSVDALLEWASFIQDSIKENYDAQITVEYLETLKCDLFCLASENCQLTPDDIFEYFSGRLSSQLTYGNLISQTLDFIVTGVWTGTEIADVMFLSQVAIRAQLGRWFDDIGFNTLDTDLRLGFNDANDDWILICDECQSEIIVDFTTLQTPEFEVDWGYSAGFNVQNAVIPQDATMGDPSVPAFRVAFGDAGAFEGINTICKIVLTNVVDVTQVKFRYYYAQPESNVLSRTINLIDDEGTVVDSWNTSADNAPKDVWNIVNRPFSAQNIKEIWVSLSVVGNPATWNNSNTYGWLDSIRIDVDE